MRITTFLILGAAIVGPALAVTEATQTMAGEWVWSSRNQTGPVSAVFTPTGESTWTVDFSFQFSGEDHVYSGTAEGSLSEGKLSGTVQNENKEHTYRFTGSIHDGEFTGTHVHVEDDGSEESTGTLTLGLPN